MIAGRLLLKRKGVTEVALPVHVPSSSGPECQQQLVQGGPEALAAKPHPQPSPRLTREHEHRHS